MGCAPSEIERCRHGSCKEGKCGTGLLREHSGGDGEEPFVADTAQQESASLERQASNLEPCGNPDSEDVFRTSRHSKESEQVQVALRRIEDLKEEVQRLSWSNSLLELQNNVTKTISGSKSASQRDSTNSEKSNPVGSETGVVVSIIRNGLQQITKFGSSRGHSQARTLKEPVEEVVMEAVQTTSPQSPAADEQAVKPRLKRAATADILATLEHTPSTSLQVIDENIRNINELYSISSIELGKGSFGTVRTAKLKASSALRAVKSIAKANITNEENIRAEISILKCLDHPHIVKLYDLFEDGNHLHIVMELCAGGTLGERIKGVGQLQDKVATQVMMQILKAVFYLHKHNICHRDLKPANCLLTTRDSLEKSNLRIADFGLSCRCEPGQVLTKRVGTVEYMAPEVLDRQYNVTCDVWSCGVIMFSFLCGHLPFKGKTDDDKRAKIRAGNMEFVASDWAHVSADTLSLVKKLLVVGPVKRCTISHALGHLCIQRHVDETTSFPLDTTLIENLLGFRTLNKFKRAALHVIVSSLDEEQRASSRKAFISLDRNGDGLLSLVELRERLGTAESNEATTDMSVSKVLNHKGSDTVHFTYTEFLAATLDRAKYCQRDVCRAAFSVFDTNSDGQISVQELSQGQILGQLSPSDLAQLASDFDQNAYGEIDFQKFMDIMRDGEGWTAPPSRCSRMPRAQSQSRNVWPSASESSECRLSPESGPSVRTKKPKAAPKKLKAANVPYWKSPDKLLGG